MEIDIDGVPWRDDIVTVQPVIENGDYLLPTGPGWGVEVNEEGLRARRSSDLNFRRKAWTRIPRRPRCA